MRRLPLHSVRGAVLVLALIGILGWYRSRTSLERAQIDAVTAVEKEYERRMEAETRLEELELSLAAAENIRDRERLRFMDLYQAVCAYCRRHGNVRAEIDFDGPTCKSCRIYQVNEMPYVNDDEVPHGIAD
jgi:hypothetical protein